jgi:hypothetical protein
MTLVLGRPLDKLARILLTTPPAPTGVSSIVDEQILLVVPLTQVMGQNIVRGTAKVVAPGANASLIEVAITADGWYDLEFICYSTTAIAAVKECVFRVIDESGVFWQNSIPISTSVGMVPTKFPVSLALKSGWKCQVFTIDAFAVGETVRGEIMAIQRFQ